MVLQAIGAIRAKTNRTEPHELEKYQYINKQRHDINKISSITESVDYKSINDNDSR